MKETIPIICGLCLLIVTYANNEYLSAPPTWVTSNFFRANN